MPTVWSRRLAVAVTPLFLASCASIGAPTGWVSKDPSTSMGTFYYQDGGRYEGGYSGEKFQGRGTIYYEYSRAHQGYTDTLDPPQLRNGQLSGDFSNGRLMKGTVSYTTEWNNNATYTPPGAFAYKGGYDGGFKGKGRVVFKDGRVFKGEFANDPTLYSYAPGQQVLFKESQLIGSYFEGAGTMRWSNGATFEGVVFRYYLFDRDQGMMNPDNLSCVSSAFYGQGLLKEPGKPDFVGLVGETYEHTAPVQAREDDFMRYAEQLAECPGVLAVARDRITGIQSELNAEMAEGRANAQAMLAADLGNLANRVSYNAARVDAASRGSTYEIEQAKQQRSADYASFISAQDADPSSDRSKRQAQAAQEAAQTAKNSANTGKSTSTEPARTVTVEPTVVAQVDSGNAEEQATQPSEAITPPDTSKPLQPTEMAKYPFKSSVTYASTYANLTREKALETVSSERANQEPMYMANAVSWRAVSVSSPDCSIREDIRETGHWVCKITVEYEGESRLNQNATPSTSGKVQSR